MGERGIHVVKPCLQEEEGLGREVKKKRVKDKSKYKMREMYGRRNSVMEYILGFEDP
jgi:hypothetical protein